MRQQKRILPVRLAGLLLAALLVLGMQPTPSYSAPKKPTTLAEVQKKPHPKRFVQGQILVRFVKGLDDKEIRDTIRAHGDRDDEELAIPRLHRIAITAGQEDAKIAEYSADARVDFAEWNGIVNAAAVPNDPKFGQQWHLRNTGQTGGTPGVDVSATTAWDVTAGSSSVQIAILDSGIDASHEDLKARISRSINFTASSTTDDRYGHGTHVAGIAGAIWNNNKGVAGVCPTCSLFNVKVLDDAGRGSWDGIANGIGWAADNGAEVINMSLGDTIYSSAVQAGVDYAWSHGAVLVASAGNNGNNVLTYPASLPNVISVASTDANDVRAATSTYGSWVNLAAPGVSIFSTAPDSSNVIWGTGVKYATLSGTSMASAVVSGIAGLVWATGHCGSGSTANACVRDKVQAGVDVIPGTGTDWMYGRVNAYKAVTG